MKNPTKKEIFMIQGIKLVVYPVKDLAQAKALYSKLLGVEPYADGDYYVGFRVGDQEIGLDPNGHNKGVTGPLVYWQVNDLKKSLQEFLEAGAQLQGKVQDVGGGMLIATIKDADGNVSGLRQLP
jgi:predicted enzyme related to lactoylglutathione lyase